MALPPAKGLHGCCAQKKARCKTIRRTALPAPESCGCVQGAGCLPAAPQRAKGVCGPQKRTATANTGSPAKAPSQTAWRAGEAKDRPRGSPSGYFFAHSWWAWCNSREKCLKNPHDCRKNTKSRIRCRRKTAKRPAMPCRRCPKLALPAAKTGCKRQRTPGAPAKDRRHAAMCQTAETRCLRFRIKTDSQSRFARPAGDSRAEKCPAPQCF